MKPPSVRFTVRRMMIVVVIVSLVFAIVAEDRKQRQNVRSMMDARNTCGAARLDLKQHEERLSSLIKNLASAQARREQCLAGKVEQRIGGEIKFVFLPNHPGDSAMLHGIGPVVYLLGETQLAVRSENRTDGPTPWTTCLASAARILAAPNSASGGPEI